MVRNIARNAMTLAIAGLLMGCSSVTNDGIGAGSTEPAGSFSQNDVENSALIANLSARRSVIPAGSSYETVARAVLAADAAVGASELRAARLRKVAADKNWLPTLSPRVSLTDLDKIATQLFVDAVLFDNGRKKAQREFARADVDVAAAVLSQDTNRRVYTALDLYIAAQKGSDLAKLSRRAVERMQHFESVMAERVFGGVSDYSEKAVVSQKVTQLNVQLNAAEQAAVTSLAELNAMSVTPLDTVRGLTRLALQNENPDAALAVLRADAERARSVTAARIERAGLLPALTARSEVSGAATITGDGPGLGLGLGASLRAVAATAETAAREYEQTREDTAREVKNLSARHGALTTQIARSKALQSEARATYELFELHYQEGHRTVMDVIGVFETLIAIERELTELVHEKALVEVELAQKMGALVDGGAI